MKAILFVAMLCLSASIFALTSFVVSVEDLALDNTGTLNDDPVPPMNGSVLGSAYPNPFYIDGSTNIDVSIKTGEAGNVTIFNILGQTVKTFPLTSGTHTLTWNSSGCSSGIYFYQLITPSIKTTKKMVLLK